MHRPKKIKLFTIIGLIIFTAAISFNIQQVSAATTNTSTLQSWQTMYQSIYSKVAGIMSSAPKVPQVNIKTWQTTIPSVTKPVIVTNPQPAPAPIKTQTPTPAPTTTQTPTPTPAPSPAPAPTASGKLWGAFLSDGNVSSFESLVGKNMDIQAVFYGFGDSFPANSDKTKTLMIFWEPNSLSLSSIIAGNSDSTITQFVSQAKSYGGPVILIPGEEINGNWDIWDGAYGSNTPAQVVSAFKHIHDVVASVGASNVKIGWDINSNSVPDTSANAISNYWPGANYVDYICVDGFNFGNPWESYSDIFSPALSAVKGYGKPIIIASMASAESSQKAAWITDALGQIAKDSSVTGFVWFNENKEQDWLVNSDSAALQAFKTAIQQY